MIYSKKCAYFETRWLLMGAHRAMVVVKGIERRCSARQNITSGRGWLSNGLSFSISSRSKRRCASAESMSTFMLGEVRRPMSTC